MQKFLADPDVETVDFDGCDFGMQDKNGFPIRKQWRVATTSKEKIEELSDRTCKHELILDHFPPPLHTLHDRSVPHGIR